MKQHNDQRISDREDKKDNILFAQYNTKKYNSARMCNLGPGGMCLITNRLLQPGSDICILTTNYSHFSDILDYEDGYRAEVIWCNEINDSFESYFGKYAVGVQFYDTIE